jgi:hypothetical protein
MGHVHRRKAAAIKPERDKLIHRQLVSDGTMVRIRKGRVLEISDEATAPHIMDLACRISDITEIFRHQRRLRRCSTIPYRDSRDP